METVLRLRMTLADRAGALGQAATVLGLHGGNIVSIDVHRTRDSRALDDLVVAFPEPPDLEQLREDLYTSAGTTLIYSEAADPRDPVESSLRGAAEALARQPGEPLSALAGAAAKLCGAPIGWVSPADEAMAFEAGRLAVEGGTAVSRPSSRLPPGVAPLTNGPVLLLAVPDPQSAPQRVVFVGRPAAMDFTETEVRRIEALVCLHRAVERLHEGV